VQIVWQERPSETRVGKWFYTSQREGTRYTVLETHLTGRWHILDNHGTEWGEFDSASDAKQAVEDGC
jgi:hypothetical protein